MLDTKQVSHWILIGEEANTRLTYAIPKQSLCLRCHILHSFQRDAKELILRWPKCRLAEEDADSFSVVIPKGC